MWWFTRSRSKSARGEPASPPLLRAVLTDDGGIEGVLISDADLSGKFLEFRLGEALLGRAMLGDAAGDRCFPFKTILLPDARAAVDVVLMPDGVVLGGALAIHRRESQPEKPASAITDVAIEIVKPWRFQPGGEAALFVAHSRTGALEPHVLPYLRSIRAANIAIQLIVVADHPVALPSEVLEVVDGAAVRRNFGDDFAVFAHALALMPDLYGASLLYLLDDSMIANARKDAITNLFGRVRADEADLIGLTASFDHRWHLQPFFLGIKSRLLASIPFQEFLGGILFPDESVGASSYKIRLTEHVENAGFLAHALFDIGIAGDPTMAGWRALVEEGFPFVRVSQLSDDRSGDRLDILARAGFDADLVRRTVASIEAPIPPRDGAYLLDRPPPPMACDATLHIVYVGPWNRAGAQGAAARRVVAALRRTQHALNLRPSPEADGRKLSPDRTISSFAGRADVIIADAASVSPTTLGEIEARHLILLRSDAEPELPQTGRPIDRVWTVTTFSDSGSHGLDPSLLETSTPIAPLAEWIEAELADVRDDGGAKPGEITYSLRAGLPPELMLSPAGFHWLILDADGTPPAHQPSIDTATWIGIVTRGSLLSPTFHIDVDAQILAQPGSDIFYADDLALRTERPIDQLRLKPEFDRTLFGAQDYIGVPLIVRGSTFAALGGLRDGMGTAALADLIFRAQKEGIGISRIPKVLLASPDGRLAPKAEDHARAAAEYRAAENVDAGPVALIIPTRRARLPDDSGTYVERLLEAITIVDWPRDPLIVVVGDDMTERPAWADRAWPFTLRWISTPRAEHEPFNYAAKMNRLAREAGCEQLIFLNDDVLPLDSNWIAALLAYAADPTVGGVGAHLLFPDGRLQHAGMAPQGYAVSHIWFRRGDRLGTYQDWGRLAREWSMVTGAVFATRASLLDEVGGFDEQFSLEFNDTDLCLRLRSLGYRIVCTPDALFEHAEKASRGATPPPGEEVARFLLRWRDWLAEDPHWHPELRRDRLEMQPRMDPDAWYL